MIDSKGVAAYDASGNLTRCKATILRGKGNCAKAGHIFHFDDVPYAVVEQIDDFFKDVGIDDPFSLDDYSFREYNDSLNEIRFLFENDDNGELQRCSIVVNAFQYYQRKIESDVRFRPYPKSDLGTELPHKSYYAIGTVVPGGSPRFVLARWIHVLDGDGEDAFWEGAHLWADVLRHGPKLEMRKLEHPDFEKTAFAEHWTIKHISEMTMNIMLAEVAARDDLNDISELKNGEPYVRAVMVGGERVIGCVMLAKRVDNKENEYLTVNVSHAIAGAGSAVYDNGKMRLVEIEDDEDEMIRRVKLEILDKLSRTKKEK
jgi:hypothetical protein